MVTSLFNPILGTLPNRQKGQAPVGERWIAQRKSGQVADVSNGLAFSDLYLSKVWRVDHGTHSFRFNWRGVKGRDADFPFDVTLSGNYKILDPVRLIQGSGNGDYKIDMSRIVEDIVNRVCGLCRLEDYKKLESRLDLEICHEIKTMWNLDLTGLSIVATPAGKYPELYKALSELPNISMAEIVIPAREQGRRLTIRQINILVTLSPDQIDVLIFGGQGTPKRVTEVVRAHSTSVCDALCGEMSVSEWHSLPKRVSQAVMQELMQIGYNTKVTASVAEPEILPDIEPISFRDLKFRSSDNIWEFTVNLATVIISVPETRRQQLIESGLGTVEHVKALVETALIEGCRKAADECEIREPKGLESRMEQQASSSLEKLGFRGHVTVRLEKPKPLVDEENTQTEIIKIEDKTRVAVSEEDLRRVKLDRLIKAVRRGNFEEISLYMSDGDAKLYIEYLTKLTALQQGKWKGIAEIANDLVQQGIYEPHQMRERLSSYMEQPVLGLPSPKVRATLTPKNRSQEPPISTSDPIEAQYRSDDEAEMDLNAD